MKKFLVSCVMWKLRLSTNQKLVTLEEGEQKEWCEYKMGSYINKKNLHILLFLKLKFINRYLILISSQQWLNQLNVKNVFY